MKNRIMALTAGLLFAFVLTGCAAKFEPKESSVYLQKDGGVTGYTVEAGFDKDYYSIEELSETYVHPAIVAYNTEAAGLAFYDAKEAGSDLPVALTKLEIADGAASMMVEYQSAKDYLAFNQNQFAEDAVFSLTDCEHASVGAVNWLKHSDNTSTDAATALGNKKAQVVSVNIPGLFQVEGKIVYQSDNAVVTSDNTFVCDGSNVVYIVFK